MLKESSAQEVANMKAELATWSSQFRASIVDTFRESGGSRTGGEGKGAGLTVDKKDVVVWKL